MSDHIKKKTNTAKRVWLLQCNIEVLTMIKSILVEKNIHRIIIKNNKYQKTDLQSCINRTFSSCAGVKSSPLLVGERGLEVRL